MLVTKTERFGNRKKFADVEHKKTNLMHTQRHKYASVFYSDEPLSLEPLECRLLLLDRDSVLDLRLSSLRLGCGELVQEPLSLMVSVSE